jgi:hypothetical protein
MTFISAASLAQLARGSPLLLPDCRTIFFKDLFHCGVTAPLLSELVIWFDLSSLPVVPRPTLEELLRVIRICRDSLRVLGVKDAIDAKTAFIDMDEMPDSVDFSSLSALHVAGATDNAQAFIEQLRWSRTAGVTTDVYITDTDPSSKPYKDLRMIFKALCASTRIVSYSVALLTHGIQLDARRPLQAATCTSYETPSKTAQRSLDSTGYPSPSTGNQSPSTGLLSYVFTAPTRISFAGDAWRRRSRKHSGKRNACLNIHR